MRQINEGKILPIALEAGEQLSASELLAEALVRQGHSATNLGAYVADGPGTGDDFFIAYELAVDSIARQANLHLLGRWMTKRFLLRLLQGRLQICDYVRQDPSVRNEIISAPIVVIGAPRTGTTALHALLSQDDRHRVPLGWEFLRPVPPPDSGVSNDPRIALADGELRLPQLVTDGISAIHSYSGMMNKECLSAMSFSFRSEEFISRYSTDDYAAWLHSCDMTSAYEMHKLVLQILQRKKPTERWVLKSPVHLHNLDVLLSTYPDAHLVMTHREPMEILGSVTSLIAQLRFAHSDIVSTEAIGRYHADLYWRDLDGMARRQKYEDQVHENQWQNNCAHILFQGLNDAPLQQVERIYAQFDISFPDAQRQAMERKAVAAADRRENQHRYSFSWLGIEPTSTSAGFDYYRKVFSL